MCQCKKRIFDNSWHTKLTNIPLHKSLELKSPKICRCFHCTNDNRNVCREIFYRPFLSSNQNKLLSCWSRNIISEQKHRNLFICSFQLLILESNWHIKLQFVEASLRGNHCGPHFSLIEIYRSQCSDIGWTLMLQLSDIYS